MNAYKYKFTHFGSISIGKEKCDFSRFDNQMNKKRVNNLDGHENSIPFSEKPIFPQLNGMFHIGKTMIITNR